MSASPGFGALVYGCGVCNTTPIKSIRCSRCGIMPYCSEEHLTIHFDKHAAACAAVGCAKAILKTEERKLREAAAPEDPFDCYKGSFWEISATRPFMLARMDVVKTLRRLRTRESVRQQLYHTTAMLELSSKDDIMARIAAPALLLRMDQDQDCYDLLKGWRIAGKVCNYEWDSLKPCTLISSQTTSKGADIFECVDYMCDHGQDLNDGTVLEHTVAMTLLKIKLVSDLAMLQKAAIFDHTDIARTLPREVLDHIRASLAQSKVVSENRRMMELPDYSEAILNLSGQIDRLYGVVKRMSDRFWPVMLDHYDQFEGRFRVHDRIGGSECPGGLRNSYDSWIETPGALDYLRAKVQGDPTSLKFFYLYS